MAQEVAAHKQHVTRSYWVAYPEHGPREKDPHYQDFHAYKEKRRRDGSYHCDFAAKYRHGDFSECDLEHPLECHHRIIEFALTNSVDLTLLEPDYPGVSSMGVGAWVESAENLELLCVRHHRGHGGVHNASYSDFSAGEYIRNLIS